MRPDTWHRNFASDRQERREAGDLLLTANTNGLDAQGRPVDGNGRLLGARVPWRVLGLVATRAEAQAIGAVLPVVETFPASGEPAPMQRVLVVVGGDAGSQDEARSKADAAAWMWPSARGWPPEGTEREEMDRMTEALG